MEANHQDLNTGQSDQVTSMATKDTASKLSETHTEKSGNLGKWSVIMKLISNWRKAHKLSSMQLMAIAAAVEAMNGVLDGVIPTWVSVSLILLAMAARVVAQDGVK